MNIKLDNDYVADLSLNPDNTLLIGNLHPDITEKMLALYFKRFGIVLQASICRFEDNGKSKGFGFIEFDENDSIADAIENMNYTPIKGWEVILIPISKDYISFGDNLVRVDNIPLEKSAHDLKEAFEYCGKINTAVIKRSLDGTSYGYGYVDFHEAAAASAAIEFTKTILIWEVKLNLYFESNPFVGSNKEDNTLVIKYFPDFWDKKDIETFIAEELITKRPIVDYKINEYKKMSEKTVYTLYITFKHKNDADKIIERYNGKFVDDIMGAMMPLYVQFTKNHKREIKSHTKAQQTHNVLKLLMLRHDIEKQEITDAFKKYGPISSIKILDQDYDIYNKRKPRTAFIVFLNETSAEKVLREYKDDINIQKLVVVKKKDSKPFLFYAVQN